MKPSDSTASPDTLLNAALDYARRGWLVLPCHSPMGAGCSCRNPDCGSPAKHPRLRHGVTEASKDPGTIRRWWAQWPDANIGVATGAVSGIVVLDEDVYKTGYEGLAALEQLHGPLPETPQQLTGGGGLQYLFRHPGYPVKNSVQGLGVGLDIRADGGYIIAPPSLHRTGKRYTWEIQHDPDETPLADMPGWLIARCQESTRHAAVDAGEPIPRGQRNDTLFRVGCGMRRRGLTESVISAALLEMNASQCRPPLSDDEVRTIATSCAAYAPGETEHAAQTHRNGTAHASPATSPQEDPGEKVTVPVTTDIKAVVDQAQAALLAAPGGPYVFQRARLLCRIAHGITPPKWLDRPDDMPVITPLTNAGLSEFFSTVADFQRYDRRAKAWHATLPPGWIGETLLSRGAWPFPLLEAIIHSPTLRPDGSLLDRPGYDASTGLYLDCNGVHYPPLRERPTLDDCRSAIGLLQEAFADFPFRQEHDFSTALAYVLSLVGRHAIQGNVPLGAISANTPGTGKTLLADVIAMIGTGRIAAKWSPTQDEDEVRKRLLALGLAGDPVACIDNCNVPLGWPALDMALTARALTDRLLGQSAAREVPINCVFLATGNNLSYRGDMARRVVPIELYTDLEKPEARTGFRHTPLLPWVKQERPRLVMAALTLLRAFFEAGCPRQGVAPIGSFEQWSLLVREALIWTGEADPALGRDSVTAESDPEVMAFGNLVACWAECYGDKASLTLNQVRDDIDFHAASAGPGNIWQDLLAALAAFDARSDGKRLNTHGVGIAIRTYKGRVFNGMRLTQDGTYRRATKWRLEYVTPPDAKKPV